MSKSLYTIRCFDAFEEGNDPATNTFSKFNCLGVIDQFNTYKEQVALTQADAIIEMLRGPLGSTFSTRNLSVMPNLSTQANVPNLPNVIDVRDDKTNPVEELMVLDIAAVINITKADLVDYRKNAVETIYRWAEKSRVRGSRGWRISAVKTPRFEKNEDTGYGYVFKTQVIIGTAVFYDQSTVKIGFDRATALKDVSNLNHHLQKAFDGFMYELRVNHSAVGTIIL